MKVLWVLLSVCVPVCSTAANFDVESQFELSYLDRESNIRSDVQNVDTETFFFQSRARATYSFTSSLLAVADVSVYFKDGEESYFDTQTNLERDGSDDDDVIVELHEFYLSYSGLTEYPNEFLRVGLQRLKESSGLLWDDDLESIVWRGDTTQLDWQLALGQQFDNYRSSLDMLEQDEKTIRFLGELIYDWKPHHKLALRAAYAEQSNKQLDNAGFVNLAGGVNGSRYWLSGGLNSSWYKKHQGSSLAYNLEFIFLNGDGSFEADNTDVVEKDIQGHALDSGIRYDFKSSSFSLGATFTRASGGESDSKVENFSQMGLHSNRSRIYGNREALFRFNDAVRFDMGNLTHFSLFTSFSVNQWTHAAISIGKFSKTVDDAPVFVSGRPLESVMGESELGTGLDLSLTYSPEKQYLLPLDLIQLKFSRFNPSSALGEQQDDQRISLEAQFVL